MGVEPELLQGWAIILLTVALVGVTAWYAWQTHRLTDTTKRAANHAADAARAAQRSALATELGLRIQSLPIVIPELVESAQLGEQLTVRNVGNTTATNIEAFIATTDGSDFWRRAISPTLEPSHNGRTVSIPFDRSTIPLALDAKAILGVEYTDPPGHRYRFERPYQGSLLVRFLRWERGMWVPFLAGESSEI
jgi:hypothetical protein